MRDTDSRFADRLEWPDGLFGACWSEEHENQLVTASGDGTVHLWDLGLANHTRGPLRVFKGHTKEVVCVDWNQTRGPPLFLSASWVSAYTEYHCEHCH